MTSIPSGAGAHIPWVDRMLRVLDHIRGHLDTELTPEPLAEMAGFSLHHFHRVFRGMVRQSVMEFVRDQRLERAAFRLKYGEQPVTQLAFDAGYGSHEAFTRAFKARFEMAPSVYRDGARAQRDDDIPISVRRESAQPALCWHRNGPYDGSADAWSALLTLAGTHGLLGPQTRFLGFVYDDPDIVPRDRLRYAAAITITADQVTRLSAAALAQPAQLATLPGGQYAVALHVGPYEASDATYVGLLGRALPTRGIDITSDPVVEIYLNSPADTPPEMLRTEILVRVA